MDSVSGSAQMQVLEHQEAAAVSTHHPQQPQDRFGKQDDGFVSAAGLAVPPLWHQAGQRATERFKLRKLGQILVAEVREQRLGHLTDCDRFTGLRGPTEQHRKLVAASCVDRFAHKSRFPDACFADEERCRSAGPDCFPKHAGQLCDLGVPPDDRRAEETAHPTSMSQVAVRRGPPARCANLPRFPVSPEHGVLLTAPGREPGAPATVRPASTTSAVRCAGWG